ncbi:MAG: citrate synthase family protein [Anaerolineae bacterium]|nr:citrate synthase family protein [Anaerolineae bacterium]
MNSSYLTAQEAATELDITVSTLYSYVSRGLIRSEVADESKRTHRYRREDIDKLKARKEQRRDPIKAVEDVLHWGTPLMESAITLIVDNRLYYRGLDAVELAKCQPVEAVAALIWAGDLASPVGGLMEPASEPFAPQLQAIALQVGNLPPVEKFQILLPLAGVDDLAAYDLRAEAVAQTGARILHLLVTLAVDGITPQKDIAAQLQQRWAADDPQAATLINAALILCADHELNVSSFTAHCVASAGATPYQAVTAGLAALQGVKHGRSTERVEAFLNEAQVSNAVRVAVAARLKRGESIPGFGHPLYPAGDPRAQFLLELLTSHYSHSPAVDLAQAIVESTLALIGEQPNIDFGLTVLARALNLPSGAPIALFALGRTIGWIGHIIEQYQLDRIIRPRARYVGELPQVRKNGNGD